MHPSSPMTQAAHSSTLLQQAVMLTIPHITALHKFGTLLFC